MSVWKELNIISQNIKQNKMRIFFSLQPFQVFQILVSIKQEKLNKIIQRFSILKEKKKKKRFTFLKQALSVTNNNVIFSYIYLFRIVNRKLNIYQINIFHFYKNIFSKVKYCIILNLYTL